MKPFPLNNMTQLISSSQPEFTQDKSSSMTKKILHCQALSEDRPEYNLKIFMRQKKLRIELRVPQLEKKNKQLMQNQEKLHSYDEYFEQLESLDSESIELKDWFDSLEDMCQYMTQSNNTNIVVDLPNKAIKIYANIETSKRQFQIQEIKLRKSIRNIKKNGEIEEQNPKKIQYSNINSTLKQMSSKLISLLDVNYNYNNQYKEKNKDNKIQDYSQVDMHLNTNIKKQKNELIQEQIYARMQILQAKILQLKQVQEEKLKSIEVNLNAKCNQIDNKANQLQDRLLGKQDRIQYIDQSIAHQVKRTHKNETYIKKDNSIITNFIRSDINMGKVNERKSMKKQKAKETKDIMVKAKESEKSKLRQGDKNQSQKETIRRRKKFKEEIKQKQNDKNSTISSQITHLYPKRQSRNNNFYKYEQMFSQQSFEQYVQQQTIKINANEKIKTLPNIPRPADARRIYRIKGILQGKKSQESEIPSFIDANSAYTCCYKFDKNKITMEKILEGTERRSIILLGSTRVSQKSVFTFNILRCDPHVLMGMGITDRRYINKRSLKAGDNVIRINSKGYILDGNKSEKVGDFIFSQGDSVTMKIHIEYCIVEWIVDNKASYSCTSTSLKSTSREWVPFVEMKRVGDCIQWIQ